MTRKFLVADLLCGAGGSSTGCGLDPQLVAWAAGVIEGEGSIQSALRSYRSAHCDEYVAIRVRVVMTDEDILARIQNVFGVGRVLAYRNTRGLGKKQLYRWDASSRADVVRVCDAIYPWMGMRRRAQIDQLRALLASHPPVSASERSRRTWVTRRLQSQRATAESAETSAK